MRSLEVDWDSVRARSIATADQDFELLSEKATRDVRIVHRALQQMAGETSRLTSYFTDQLGARQGRWRAAVDGLRCARHNSAVKPPRPSAHRAHRAVGCRCSGATWHREWRAGPRLDICARRAGTTPYPPPSPPTRIQRKRFVLAAACLLTPALLAAQTTISAPGGTSINPFGHPPNTATYGQTFVAPTVDSRLDSFSFWVANGPGINFRSYVFAWDALSGHATGDALFTGSLLSGPSGADYTEIAVSTGGVNLTPGGMFVAFFSTTDEAGSGGTTWSASTGEYGDGSFVYFNNSTRDQWTTEAWDGATALSEYDAQFSMTFNAADVSTVPEPASLALLATGLLGLGGMGLRRRARA